jgi:MFS family permease
LTFTHGIHSWQWIFIIEGIPTLALGAAIFFLLPNEPQHVAEHGHLFFNGSEERSILLERYHANTSNSKPKMELKQVWAALKDPKAWLGGLSLAAPCLGVTAFSLFLPTFIKEFGFSSRKCSDQVLLN